jgi:signal transduction histidine kinase
VAITIVRRAASAADGPRVLMTGGANQGAWQVRARYRSGSLESIVASSRRRNLAISLGVLGLLAAAFILVMAASQRQRRLAQQQMEFVASVSHELRTPLAVICSAGENLADGVVADGAQVRTYGALIETEGRRLGDMVERVMEFAGIGSGASISARAGVDVAMVVADAVHGVSADARARDITVTVHPNGTLPVVTGDAGALRSAVQNIIGNAVKYSPDGGTVDVRTHVDGAGVEIRVADRGLGIDAADLPHIFKPFYRGRRAVDAQVRGTGVGLSVVRHVIHAHQGTIAVDSRVGEGTTIIVKLPA